MENSWALHLVVTALVCTVAAGISGCGAALNSSPAAAVSLASLSGSIHGGQQPVSGAAVSLIAPGTTGYGSPGTVIVTTTSDVNGAFTLPRPYTCPANSGLVYLLATGGNAGAGPNPLIAEAAILGPCSALTASTFVNVTEVTTVAAAYALAPFATITAGSTAIGTSATNLQGLYNAAGPSNNLANTTTGSAHTTGDFPGIVPPTAELNTLADILAACVNQGTTGVPAGSCATLLAAATPTAGVPPTDTFQAAIDIALHPGNNPATLFGLVTPTAPFQPTLSTAPGDFSVALGFNGGGISIGGTIGVAIDALGNAWITTGVSDPTVHSLTEISPAGVYLSGSTVAASTGFDSALISRGIGVAIDKSGFIYVANNTPNNILKFNTDASLNATLAAASLSGPNGITTDGAGNVWVADFNSTINHVTEITAAGTEAALSPYATGNGGVDIAAGPLAIWETDYASRLVSRIDLTSFAVTNIGIGGPSGGIAVDHANNAWVAVTGNGNVFEINNAGVIVSPFGGYVYPNGVAQNITIDGLGNAFAGGYLPMPTPSMGGLAEFSNSGVLLSPGNGFGGSNVIPVVPEPPEGIHIDGSGNVWIAGSNNGTTLPNYVAEVIGIAAPVVTPRGLAVANNMLGVRP